MTVIDGVVGAAVTDPTKLLPGDAPGAGGARRRTPHDPQKLFGEKIYDADNKTFSDRAAAGTP